MTVYRRDPDGHSYPVRTSDGGPLPLSGGLATLWDYEAPLGAPVTYYTDDTAAVPVATELSADRPWLIHPGIPSRSFKPFALGRGTNQSESWDVVQGSFTVLRRSTPVVTSGGARLQPSSQLVIGTTDVAQRAALKLLLSDGAPLFLNVPPDLGWDIDTCYIAVGKVQVDRFSPLLRDGFRFITLPYQVVARPAGGTQAAYNWDNVAGQYTSWQAIDDAGVADWNILAAPVG